MSGDGGLVPEEVGAGPAAEPQAAARKPQEGGLTDKPKKITGDGEEEENSQVEEAREDEEEEEVSRSAHLEPSTLPWPGDRDKRCPVDNDDKVWSEKDSEERDTGISGGSQDLYEERSQAGGESKNKWRESMPEGERWRDDEINVHRDKKGDGSMADDEEEEEGEEDNESNWVSEKAALGFTPKVTIVNPSGKEAPEESRLYIEKQQQQEEEEEEEEEEEREPQGEHNQDTYYYPHWTEEDDKIYLCENACRDKLKVVVSTVAAGVVFPLLVWGGYALLPFDPPLVQGAPLRVVYTLRCAFFAIIPIMLGVLVQGVARLRYGAMKPLYVTPQVHRHVRVHWHYVSESLGLFLFFFLQLAVMATYISQDLVKLVPLLTIVFVFGRFIYWLCLALGSTIRGFGFGLSFLPILVMLGTNLYFICSSGGEGAVFDVAPPPTDPPPSMPRFFG